MPSSTSAYNQSQLAHYAFLESMDSKIKALRNQAIEKKRAASLEMFLAEDLICLLKTKKHPTLPNDIIGPLYMETEEEPLNLWRCFGRCPQPGMKKNLKRTASKEAAPVPTKASKFNASAPVFVPKSSVRRSSFSGFNRSALEFIPKTASGSSTPTGFNVSAPEFIPKSRGSFNLKRTASNDEAPISKKSSRFNASAPVFVPKSSVGSSSSSGFNADAPEFVPKSASGSSSPTGFNIAAPEFVPKRKSSTSSSSSAHISPPPASGDYVFNVGVANAPKQGVNVEKYELENGEFVLVAKDSLESPSASPPKKIRAFSQEEIQKQGTIVKEMKKKFIRSL